MRLFTLIVIVHWSLLIRNPPMIITNDQPIFKRSHCGRIRMSSKFRGEGVRDFAFVSFSAFLQKKQKAKAHVTSPISLEPGVQKIIGVQRPRHTMDAINRIVHARKSPGNSIGVIILPKASNFAIPRVRNSRVCTFAIPRVFNSRYK